MTPITDTSTQTVPDPELSTHVFITLQEGSDVLVVVAGRLSGSYQDLGYSIGDYIRIGGVTETIGDLQPDDVNDIHEIVKFEESGDEYSDFRYAFCVKVDATSGLNATVQAWTQPFSVALDPVSGITETNGVADVDIISDETLD